MKLGRFRLTWTGVGVIISLVVSVSAAGFTAFDVFSSNARGEKEIELLRRQVTATSRPTLVPVVDANSPTIRITNDGADITLRNVSAAPSLGGVIGMLAPEPLRPSNRRPDSNLFPTCSGLDADLAGTSFDHFAWSTLPAMAAGETATVVLETYFDTSVPVPVCLTAVYLDATGIQWVTDWSWVAIQPFERPIDLRSFQALRPEWWSEDVPQLFSGSEQPQ